MAVWLVMGSLLVPGPGGRAAASALQFDGVDDYVDIGPWPGISSEVMSKPVTFEAWVKSANTTSDMTLIGPVNTVDNMFLRITLNRDGRRAQQPGGIKLLQRSPSGPFFVGGTASKLNTGITNGEWRHLALVFNPPAGNLAIYVDGVSQELVYQDAAKPVNMTAFQYPVLPLGARNYRGVIDQCFQGLMAEVRIWSCARTEAEIQENMAVPLAGQPAGLVGYWPFHEGQGTTAYDSSGQGRPGTLVGSTWTVEGPPVVPLFAFSPVPAPGAVDVPRDVVLSWTAAEDARSHNLYLGDDLAKVSTADVANPQGVLAAQNQTGTTFVPPGGLEFGRTYYWRVEEVGGAPGSTWSFTVEPKGYVLAQEHVTATASSQSTGAEGPEKTIDGSGLDAGGAHSTAAKDMWLSGSVPAGEAAWIQYEFDQVYALHQMRIWNHNSETEHLIGFGIKTAAIAYSLDGVAWTAAGEAQELGRATGTAGYAAPTTIALGSVAARYVRITAASNWGGVLPQYGLSEVQFLYVPMSARAPEPAAGATDVSVETVLTWRPGRGAVSHEVHLSADRLATVAGSAPIDTTTRATTDPGPLNLGTTYYWKVNEVNEAAVPKVWEGPLWDFTTREFFLVDDFEAYTDDEPQRIFDTWADGWDSAENGATVGHPDPAAVPSGHFAETKIVHGGKQSLPFYYDNTGTARYSEARRTFATTEDWTVYGADTLQLHFCGSPLAFLEHAAGSISMSGFGTNIWGKADGFRFAYQSLSGDGAIVARVDSLVDTHESAKACVMIRKTVDAGSSYAALCLTPRKGILFTLRLRSDVAAVWGDPQRPDVSTPLGSAAKAPYWIKLERSGDAFGAYYSADGVTWSPAYGSPQTIPMGGEVLIGLGLTSRSSTVPTFAEFSKVSLTGKVTGPWQVVAVGAAQPSNDPAPLYVTLSDSTGRTATVTHPDALAITSINWQSWPVALRDLAAGGVNLSRIKTLTIGVGPRQGASPDARGLLYLDDIQWGHPASVPEK